MANQEIRKKIDEAIKYVWIHDIQRDYWQYSIQIEATLQSAYYHHLRKRLGARFFNDNDIRIFCEWEYDLSGRKKYADLAFVQLGEVQSMLKYSAKDVIAIIELKYGGRFSKLDFFKPDIEKMKNFRKSRIADELYSQTYYYLGFFQEHGLDKAFDYVDYDKLDKNECILYGNCNTRPGDNGDGAAYFGIDHSNDLNKTVFKDYTWPKHKGVSLISE
jgi:hypothetical protein